ncbi:3454_t:CDS:2, partial [Entrophospora sp. SA101]
MVYENASELIDKKANQNDQNKDKSNGSDNNTDNNVSSAFKILDFLHFCEQLKRTKRTGWVDNGIKDPESISDHMHHITPFQGISKSEKNRRESEAMKHLCKELLNDSQQSKEIFDLWQEYEDGISNEAKFVKDLDKFELILQAFEYEQSQNKDLEEFFESTKGKFNHSLVKSWVGELYRKRMDVVKKEEIEDDIDDKEDVWI